MGGVGFREELQTSFGPWKDVLTSEHPSGDVEID